MIGNAFPAVSSVFPCFTASDFHLAATTCISLVKISYCLYRFLVNFRLPQPLTEPSAPRWNYDVFLSFRGEETRKGIAFEIYDGLKNRGGIKTFMDDQELQVGESISPSLLKAIEESRFAIVVLSPNYASSSWCLEELTKIVDCMKDENRILPLFYHVEPSDVRQQKNSFEVAFTKHEATKRHDIETVKQWRDALKTVANFSGWHTQNYKTERELVEAIVESVCNKLQRAGYLADYKSNPRNLPTKLEDYWSCIWRSGWYSFCCSAICQVSVRVLYIIYWSILASPNEIFFFVIVICVVGYTDWLITNQNYFKHKKFSTPN